MSWNRRRQERDCLERDSEWPHNWCLPKNSPVLFFPVYRCWYTVSFRANDRRFVAGGQHWDEYNAHFTLGGKPRLRISYNQRNSKIPLIKDKLSFIQSYLKSNPLQEYHGATYGMSQPQCNQWVHLLSEILLKTLGELPDRNHLRVKMLDRTMPKPTTCWYRKTYWAPARFRQTKILL